MEYLLIMLAVALSMLGPFVAWIILWVVKYILRDGRSVSTGVIIALVLLGIMLLTAIVLVIVALQAILN